MPPPTLRMVAVERFSREQLLMGERIATDFRKEISLDIRDNEGRAPLTWAARIGRGNIERLSRG